MRSSTPIASAVRQGDRPAAEEPGLVGKVRGRQAEEVAQLDELLGLLRRRGSHRTAVDEWIVRQNTHRIAVEPGERGYLRAAEVPAELEGRPAVDDQLHH